MSTQLNDENLQILASSPTKKHKENVRKSFNLDFSKKFTYEPNISRQIQNKATATLQQSKNGRQRSTQTSQKCYFKNLNQIEEIRSIFQSKYQTLQKLGEGCQASVYKCAKKSNGKLFAVKIIKNNNEELLMNLQQNFNMLQQLNHDNIIKVEEIIFDEANKKTYLVLELCECDNLRSLIQQQQKLSQIKIRSILKQLFSAINYLHSKNICHRDLKPENILYNEKQDLIKIVDFQISKQQNDMTKRIQMWTNTGSLHYRAPQSFQGCYNELIDIWAIGVIAYELIVGKMPFKSMHQHGFIKKVKQAEINFNDLKLSKEQEQLLQQLLRKNPEERITASAALNCQYLRDQLESDIMLKSCGAVSTSYDSNENLQQFQTHGILNIREEINLLIFDEQVEQSYQCDSQN